MSPRVIVELAETGEELDHFERFFAYDVNFRGGVRVASAEFNGDGAPDVITAAGPGGGPHVRVFDDFIAQPIAGFFAYDLAFTAGVLVAAADIDGDGRADVITGAGAGGGPHVRVSSGADSSLLVEFFAYDAGFAGGVRVAAGNISTKSSPGWEPAADHMSAFSTGSNL